MIDERTKYLPAERATERRKGFEPLFSNSTVFDAREANDLRLGRLRADRLSGFQASGQLPRNERSPIYLKLDGENPAIVAARLWDVPFYRTKNDNGSHTLTCHGMGGVWSMAGWWTP